MICFSKILGFPFRNDGKLFLFFTACYIPDHIPEWKQNIKVKKKKKNPRSQSSSGTLTGVHSTCLCFCPSFSFFKCLFRSLFIYSRRENIPCEFLFPFFETCGGSRGREEGRIRHPEFFGTGWAFLRPSSLALMPQKFKTQQDSWLMIKMH